MSKSINDYDYLIDLCDKAYRGTVMQQEIVDFLHAEKYTGTCLISEIKEFIKYKKLETKE